MNFFVRILSIAFLSFTAFASAASAQAPLPPPPGEPEQILITATRPTGITFAAFVNEIIAVINLVIIPLLVGAAFLVFIWGVVNYFFLHAGEEEKRREARSFALWGVLGLVLLFSLWGVVNILLDTFNARLS